MSSSLKRPAPSTSSPEHHLPPSKQPKKAVHSFFAPQSDKAKLAKEQQAKSFWVKDGPPSVLHYSHLSHLFVGPLDLPPSPPPAPSSSSAALAAGRSAATPTDPHQPAAAVKVAFFDLDGTLIKTASGAKFPKSATDWVFWTTKVKDRLDELHATGWRIAIISNQNGLPVAKSGAQKKRDEWVAKVEAIARKFPETPFEVLAALDKDHFRKPLLGLWDLYNERLGRPAEGGGAGAVVDVKQSYYVGDAAGRAKDHGDGDRKWAANAGITFYTPEMFFDGKDDPLPPIQGFQPTQLEEQPLFSPTTTPLVPSSPSTEELILLVGPPGAGKSRFCETYLVPAGYVRVCQDELKTKAKCLARAREVLERTTTKTSGGGEVGGEAQTTHARRVVVDATNRDRTTRKAWVDLAREFGVDVRIFLFPPTPALLALAKHNNLYRLYPSTSGRSVPPIATATFTRDFEAVDGKVELGSDDKVKRIWMGGWQGGGEEERRRWQGWMS